MASEHIWQNQMSYHDFIAGDFENYVQTIRKYGTNANHTTLIAIAREMNIQILVISTVKS